MIERTNKYLILVIPPKGAPEVRAIKTFVEDMDSVIENKKADFDYYNGVIIATNGNRDGLPRNENIKDLEVYGTCYLIGNDKKSADFASLKYEDINKFLNKLFTH
jgi:hypothetical protein